MNVYVVMVEGLGYGADPNMLCQVFADLNGAMKWCDSQYESTIEWTGSTGCGLQSWTSNPLGEWEDYRFAIERRFLIGA